MPMKEQKSVSVCIPKPMIPIDELEPTAQCLVIRLYYIDEHMAHYASRKKKSNNLFPRSTTKDRLSVRTDP